MGNVQFFHVLWIMWALHGLCTNEFMCNHKCYGHDVESLNELETGKCINDCDCESMRTCVIGKCKGESTYYKSPSCEPFKYCNTKCYDREEAFNKKGQHICQNDCECASIRQCINGVCSGTSIFFDEPSCSPRIQECIELLQKYELKHIWSTLQKHGFNYTSLWVHITDNMLQKMNLKDSEIKNFKDLQQTVLCNTKCYDHEESDNMHDQCQNDCQCASIRKCIDNICSGKSTFFDKPSCNKRIQESIEWLEKYELSHIWPILKKKGFNVTSLWLDITNTMLHNMNIKDSDIIRFTNLQKNLKKYVEQNGILDTQNNFKQNKVLEEPSNSINKLTENVFELYKSVQYEFDIVFIHGLDGDGFTTWCVRGNDCDVKSDRLQSAIWPRIWLGEILSEEGYKTRILTINYDASSSKWIGSDGYTLGVFERSKQLVEQLATRAVGVFKKPIFFVAHSLGGLIVKQMLSHASRTRTGPNKRLKKLLNNVKGVAFYGVPHQGSDKADLLKYFKYIARGTDLINDLESSTNSVIERNAEYEEIESEYNIYRYCFIETKDMPIMSGIKGKIVPEQSARHGCGQRYTPVNGHHAEIVKPASKTDISFIKLCDFLMDLMDDLKLKQDL